MTNDDKNGREARKAELEAKKVELQKQLSAIREEEAAEEERAKAHRDAVCLANIDVLLEIAYEHTYNKCTDGKFYCSDCPRCCLLRIKKEAADEWPAGCEVTIVVDHPPEWDDD